MVPGDSISAAYGIERQQGWVALLSQALEELSMHETSSNYQLINASISGETTGGALSRLPGLLTAHRPAIVIIELGGNDGLCGYPISNIRNNLQELVRLSQQSGARVLLTAMHIPPNYGKRYASLFYQNYQQVAAEYQVPMVPFLLADIATDPTLMQADRIHPTAQAQARILQNVMPYLKELL